MATDWVKLKLEYVHGTDALRDLADKYNIKAAGVMRRAANEGWDSARKQESAKVSNASNAILGDTRVTELAKFNDDDLKVARGLRQKAASMLSGMDNPQDLRALAGVFDAAQKIGRLALGADKSHDATDDEASVATSVKVTVQDASKRSS